MESEFSQRKALDLVRISFYFILVFLNYWLRRRKDCESFQSLLLPAGQSRVETDVWSSLIEKSNSQWASIRKASFFGKKGEDEEERKKTFIDPSFQDGRVK